ncbi:Sua5/YciO/YrdC/YwlC family protein [Candidatus Roizmanbacteria bacterium]|nr:MAG: Sua5/YciO/YrdC/YwlC family protein [Candidatus Roizmanbacteria bacterium]
MTCGGTGVRKGTLGIRIPDNKEIIDLVNTFGKPLTATSANLAGRPPHYSIKSFNKQVAHGRKNLVDLIVDGEIYLTINRQQSLTSQLET